MAVEVTESLGGTVDRMETVRFLVFKNVAAGVPTLELNQLFDVPASSGEKEVSRFKITLELGMRPGRNNEKMVVAVVNEPVEMTPQLDVVWDYAGLENATLDFGHFLHSEQTALLNGKSMPMSGVVWTDNLYATPEEAESDPVELSVLRAAARVDVYLRQEAGLGLTLGAGSTFTLSHSYGRGYLVRQVAGTRAFGKIQTITSGFATNNLTLSASDSPDLPEVRSGEKGRLVASFYTAERTCQADSNGDKLQAGIGIITGEGASRTGAVIIDRFNKAGVPTDILVVERNNIYEIIATVGSNSITATVNDWTGEPIVPEL